MFARRIHFNSASRKRFDSRWVRLLVAIALLVFLEQNKGRTVLKQNATVATFRHLRETSESKPLVRASPTVACWVLRTNNSVQELVASSAIANGWGTGCSVLEFIDSNTPDIDVDWEEGYIFLAAKSFRAWHFMYEKYVSNEHIDFILKADLDTYVLWDNLKLYLANFSPTEHHYLGKKLVRKNDTIVGGPCIILSRATFERFVGAGRRREALCSREDFLRQKAEDVALAKCLHSVHILPNETRDSRGAERFMSFDPATMLQGPLPLWYKAFSQNKIVGKGCCSSQAIAFHYVSPANQSRNLVYKHGYWDWD